MNSSRRPAPPRSEVGVRQIRPLKPRTAQIGAVEQRALQTRALDTRVGLLRTDKVRDPRADDTTAGAEHPLRHSSAGVPGTTGIGGYRQQSETFAGYAISLRSPANRPHPAREGGWIAPRRSPVRVRLAPFGRCQNDNETACKYKFPPFRSLQGTGRTGRPLTGLSVARHSLREPTGRAARE
jgi:hypothetical protein